MHTYYDRAGNPVSSLTEWLRRRTQDQVTVARTELPGVVVSTVWLGINLSVDEPPVLFETAIFGGPHNETHWRYATEAAALAWHDQVVSALKAGRQP